MTPEQFVSGMRSAIVEANAVIYMNLLESMTVRTAKDSYWKRVLALYASLSEADRVVLFEIMRQSTVDALSNVFGILDGSSSLGNKQENFTLTSEDDNQKLNGSLQDIFLAMEEKANRSRRPEVG